MRRQIWAVDVPEVYQMLLLLCEFIRMDDDVSSVSCYGWFIHGKHACKVVFYIPFAAESAHSM